MSQKTQMYRRYAYATCISYCPTAYGNELFDALKAAHCQYDTILDLRYWQEPSSRELNNARWEIFLAAGGINLVISIVGLLLFFRQILKWRSKSLFGYLSLGPEQRLMF